MNEDEKKITIPAKTRRSVLAGIGLLSAFSLFKFGFFSKKKDVISCAPPPESGGTMKMLTQDGKLVEVDIAHLGALKQKISDKELQEWVKR